MTQAIADKQSIKPDELGTQDKVKFWLDPRFDNLECLHAQFMDHHYSPHSHDTYVLGYVESGMEHCRNRGRDFTLTPGRVTIINPGDIHDGTPGKDGYVYRMFYPAEKLMRRALSDISDASKVDMPWFSSHALDDPDLTKNLMQAHHLSESGVNDLAVEVAMLEAMALLIHRYADVRPQLKKIGDERSVIAIIQDYMSDNIDTEIKLDDLSEVVNLNRFQLIRMFKKETNQTPHAYLLNQRINRAKCYMNEKLGLAEPALACGFYDQSHMNRAFKGAVGFTPGAYQRAVCNLIQ